MTNKKSLYEILEVANDATFPEIRASHERLTQSLNSLRSTLSHEDYSMQLRLLKVAYSTLAAPMSRDSYDAHLSIRSESAKPESVALVTTPAIGQGAAAVRAEALLMRADALSLRAEAMGLKADLLSGQARPGTDLGEHPLVGLLLASFKKVLLILGTLVAIGMVFKVTFMVTRNVPSDQVVDTRSPTEDKAFFQEYYQTWGVRPASRAEAELMDAERSKNDEVKRAQRQRDDAKRKTENDAQQFEEESRRRGEQVSAELRYAEEKVERAKQEEEQQQERAKNAKAETERRRAEAEQARVEAEQAKWRKVLDRN
ncbi:MAG: hypothetical protein V4858_02850 [Pseudomonadota bacterium]